MQSSLGGPIRSTVVAGPDQGESWHRAAAFRPMMGDMADRRHRRARQSALRADLLPQPYCRLAWRKPLTICQAV